MNNKFVVYWEMELARMIENALNSAEIKPRYREIFLMYYQDEMDIHDISKKEQLTPTRIRQIITGVRTRIAKGRADELRVYIKWHSDTRKALNLAYDVVTLAETQLREKRT